MDEKFQALIDAIDNAREERAVRTALKSFCGLCGFERYSYLHVNSTETSALTDYPAEWQSQYLQNAYVSIDPVVTAAKRSRRCFTWSAEDRTARKASVEVRHFYAEAAKFGIRSGLSIPIPTSYGRTAMLTLASNDPQADSSALEDPFQAALSVAYVHIHLNLIAAEVLATPEIALSPQEATCLSWSSHGKSMNVIADILGLSPRTVQFHLNAARDKLGATNLQHAVRIAILKQLI